MVYALDSNVLLVHMRLFILVPVMFCEDSLVFVLRQIRNYSKCTICTYSIHTVCTQYTAQYYLMTIYYLVIDYVSFLKVNIPRMV